MKICAGFGLTVYSTIFISLEFISIIILFILFLRKIINLWNYPNNSYDKIDIILIYLSEIQLVLFFLRLCKNYNIFSVLVLINKFSQNLMICALLMIIILDKYSNSKTKIINYFLITLLIADILLFLIGINDNESFKQSEAESMSNVIIALLCTIINAIIIYKSYIFKVEGINKINENINNNKLVSLQNYNNINSDNDNNDEEQNNEKDFFNTVLNQYLSNAITILSVYLYILIPFLLSYIIEIIIYFFFNSKNNNINEDEIISNNNSNSTINNNTINNNNTNINNTSYNDTNINITDYNNSNFINNTNDICIFVQNNEDTFNFGKLLICFILFVLRDFLPYFMTYLMFFYYKLKHHRRSF